MKRRDAEMKAYIMDENRQLVVREMPEPIATENNAIINVEIGRAHV